jgi:tetraacyldisaccharide 4'-kinase
MTAHRIMSWKGGRAPRAPVISVGNIALGGRGKTPTAEAVARLLVAAGERPSILSRGYHRREPEDGVVVVSDGTHLLADLERSGDEPLMLARHVPGAAVLVCDVRAEAAALAESSFGVSVHLLDDGFQHRSIRRDVDLVVVTPGDLGDRRVPFGRLRASPRTLRRADAVLVDGAPPDDVAAALDRLGVPAATPRFALTRRLGVPWVIGRSGERVPTERPVVAMAGIARPDRFSRALEHDGWTVAGLLPYADHHVYTARDVVRMADALTRLGAAAVLTTEKDAMRLMPWRPLPVPVAAVPLIVDVEPAPAFAAWLRDRLREVRACA